MTKKDEPTFSVKTGKDGKITFTNTSSRTVRVNFVGDLGTSDFKEVDPGSSMYIAEVVFKN